LVGFTRVWWHEGRPGLLTQGDTAVDSDHRNQGIGRWLKAEMILRILAERPEARLIRTGNASDNAPMLAINTALGFQPFQAHTSWRAATAELASVLDT
jgi:mycothiol synthase